MVYKEKFMVDKFIVECKWLEVGLLINHLLSIVIIKNWALVYIIYIFKSL